MFMDLQILQAVSLAPSCEPNGIRAIPFDRGVRTEHHRCEYIWIICFTDSSCFGWIRLSSRLDSCDMFVFNTFTSEKVLI